MQLETYISDLLYRYDCVTVPSLGAFLTHRVSAKIHESTHTFYPPKKLLSFNEQLQHNDGLLANYIAEIEKIPYQVAVEKLAKQVKAIKSYLVEGETIAFKNIGDLLLNAEGRIVFNPSYHINYLTDAFGLSHFNSNNVIRETQKDVVLPLDEKAPIALTSERRSNPWLRYAAAAVVILGLGTLGAGKIYNDSVNEHNQIVQQEANNTIENKIQEATFFISNPLPAASLSIEKQTGSYHIVAGAFRIEANSDKKVEQLRALGYKARKIGANRYGLHEVVYSSFENRLDAQKAMYQIRKEHNKEAWLLVKNTNK